MTADPDIPILLRPSFFDGQRLRADDLSITQDFHREMRWLHNRSLHTWGIALGLMVTGQRGDRTVTIQPGYALDCLGRDLLLSEVLTMAVPPASGDDNGDPVKFYLTASYLDDAGIPASETRTGVCEGDGAVRRPEGPLVQWKEPSAEPSGYRRGYDVILASIRIQNCKLSEPVNLDERRDARPADQPYVAAGSTSEGSTVWELWPDQVSPAGFQTVVDTSQAGFGSTPQYMANVVGNRVASPPGGGKFPTPGQLLDGFVDIVVPSPTSFTLQMTMPFVASGKYDLNPEDLLVKDTLDQLQNDLKWYVVWMGVES